VGKVVGKGSIDSTTPPFADEDVRVVQTVKSKFQHDRASLKSGSYLAATNNSAA
jgi:hypothetical protein